MGEWVSGMVLAQEGHNLDHTKLGVGVHLVKCHRLGGVVLYEYDLRMCRPVNGETVMSGGGVLHSAVIHTIEHLLAFWLRRDLTGRSQRDDESVAKDIVSVYPYGCKTGFGVLSLLVPKVFFNRVGRTLVYITKNADTLEVPFSSEATCGNIFLNDLVGAVRVLDGFLDALRVQRDTDMDSLENPPRLS